MSALRARMLSAPAAALLVPFSAVAAAEPRALAGVITRCPAAPYGVSRSAPATAGRTVALTFDDGPGRDTARIMSILATRHVAATFFNLGVDEARVPASVRAEKAAGFALGDHTWDHRDLRTLSARAQASEMDRERAEQARITGTYSCLFRPPYGSYDVSTTALARRRGMRVWNWSVDTEDWKAAGSGASYWVRRITSRAVAGGSQTHPVILMHNQPAGNPATAAALPGIIDYYRSHGYRFVDLYGRGAAPSSVAVSPTSASTAGGTRVRVTGRSFAGVRGVRFGGVAGSAVRVVSPTLLYVTSPAHAAGSVHIQVTTTFGTSAAAAANAFRYVSPSVITAITPSAGPTAGAVRVRVSSTDFRSVTSVRFGTATGTGVDVVSPTTLYVTAPAHAAGRADIHVATRYGTSAVRVADQFSYTARPVISSITPPVGPTDGATTVRVTGANFGSVDFVTFDGVPGTAVSVTSSTVLTVSTPPHAVGTVDVLVTTKYGGSSFAGLADRYTYLAP